MRRLLELGYGIYAGIAMGAVLLSFAPLVLLLPGLPVRRAVGRVAVRLGLLAALVPLRVRGLQHLPAGPCIVVSNHASYLDGPLLTAALPGRFTFVVQHGAAEWALVGRIIQRMGVTFVDRGSARAGAQQTRGLIRRLAEGGSLAIFPEGTFEDAPGLLPFRKGAFLMAAHAGVPVVPAVIRGSRRLFGEGRKTFRWQPIEIEFFPPPQSGGDHRHAAAELRDAVRQAVLANCGEPDALSPGPSPASGRGEQTDSSPRRGERGGERGA
jgi:1-acyl-sn-glycerol-3-phosphate acyltransferase